MEDRVCLFRDIITEKLKREKSMTFAEICEYMKDYHFTEWETATTLPTLCKLNYLQKVTKTIKKKKFFSTTEETETRYYLK